MAEGVIQLSGEKQEEDGNISAVQTTNWIPVVLFWNCVAFCPQWSVAKLADL